MATLVLGYLVGLGGMILVKGVFLSADRYFLILLVPALFLRTGRAYVRDFLPFIALMLVYEEARGVAHLIHPHPFYEPMLTIDRWLGFGEVPTNRLQDWLWHGHLEWYDHALSLLDRLHFIVPPTLLLLIWLERRDVFYRCAATLVAVSFAGAATFAAFPAAPPWLASKHHLIPHVYRIGYIEGGDSPVEHVEVVDRGPHPREPGRGGAVAARRLRHARPALRVRLARPHRRPHRGALHARDVVHGRLPGRPLRRRHRRRHGLCRGRLGAHPEAPAATPLRALLGPFPAPLAAGDKQRSDVLRSGHER